jgi:thiamine-phosphate pyrophosphorylase
MKDNIDYTLYLCTDRGLMSSATIEESVELAVKGGCTVVQLREKEIDSAQFYQLGLRVRDITRKYNVPLIINDRVDIAIAIDADGVHVGQGDLPCTVVRGLIGADKIVGVSASNLQEALQAVKDGADYLGVGAMYATGTKTDAVVTTIQELKKIRQNVRIPIVVIGGINKNTIPDFIGTDIDGVAVVSAIVAQPDVLAAASELRQLLKSVVPS